MYIFIVNPIAGNGRAKRVFAKLQKSPLFKQINSKSYFTRYKGHAEEISQQISTKVNKKIKSIIVVGGDGTLHEVINGLDNNKIPVAIIPSGSGNDFARGCGIKGNAHSILERIIHQNKQLPYWVGHFTPDEETTRSFNNHIGFGFDAEIVKAANQSWFKKALNRLKLGKLTYLLALIITIFRFKPITVTVDVNGELRTYRDCLMVSVANHPFYGGGIKLLPFAKIKPVTFPVFIVKKISRLKLLSFFMTVFTGAHLKMPEVEVLETSRIKITSTNELTYQADGETGTCYTCLIQKQIEPIWINGSTKIETDSKVVDL